MVSSYVLRWLVAKGPFVIACLLIGANANTRLKSAINPCSARALPIASSACSLAPGKGGSRSVTVGEGLQGKANNFNLLRMVGALFIVFGHSIVMTGRYEALHRERPFLLAGIELVA